MAVYLVTGGGGFIGSHLVEHLLDEGHQVRVIDNFLTGRRENLKAYLNQIELYQEDIRNPEAIRSIVQGVDYVLHQAALPSVARSLIDPLSCHQINTGGTLNLLLAAREAKVKRFVFASSSSVYGANPKLPKQEAMHTEPLSPYAISKLAAELYCQNFYQLFGLPAVILRYFNVFGPRQDPNSEYAAVIPKFIKALLAKEAPTVYGDGEQSRDFTYIDNVVDANLLAVRSPSAPGRIFNIGCSRRTTLNQLLAIMKKITGSSQEAVYTAPRPGDVRHSQADITQARESLGYQPQVSLEEGLALTVEYWRAP